MITQEMRPVYITEDGAEFGDEVAAQKHELTLFLATARMDTVFVAGLTPNA